MRPHLRVMADYGCYPLWLRDRPDEVSDNVDPVDMPISPSLAGRLNSWANWFESFINMADPHDSRDVTPAEMELFDAEGRLLSARLGEEMRDTCVYYWKDPDPCG